jgi:glycosyltransferase involved in cell wall biosynthesis
VRLGCIAAGIRIKWTNCSEVIPERIALMPASILFVHQGYELYGSDRTLMQSVEAAARRWPNARITVLLPSDGVLREALLPFVRDVRVTDLAILRKSDLKKMKMRDVGGLLKKILKARRMICAYDLTYINTVMVMDYILAACVARRPRIVHVHEIPTGAASLVFSALLMLTRGFAIFNSNATRRSFRLLFRQQFAIVWNGVAAAPDLPAAATHLKLNLLLIGRFNSWKGQALLLRAAAQLPAGLRRGVNIRLVGSVFGDQKHFADELVTLISELGLSETVEICPFTTDPYLHYSWADVVVVPSTKPEPFGLVAIEAMATGRSVIAANHGGLAEIVVDGVTGSLFEPGSVESLAAAIASYIDDPERITDEGSAGRNRFEKEFEESHYKTKITNIIERVCESSMA